MKPLHASAFSVAPQVAALPLAGRRRRVLALLLDLAVIGCVSAIFRFPALPAALLVAVLVWGFLPQRLPAAWSLGLRRAVRVGATGTCAGLILLLGWRHHQSEQVEEASREKLKDADDDEDDEDVVRLTGHSRAEFEKHPELAAAAALRIVKDQKVLHGDAAKAVDVALAKVESALPDAGAAPPSESPALTAARGRIANLEGERDSLRTQLAKTTEALKAARESTGILHFMVRAAEDLGIEIGWAAVYFLFFMRVWNGQTPGKRLTGIRVVRLDGKAITWWTSFERFHGYCSCLFTGLLGFIQVLWDHNYQGHHDKIAETVVVLDVGK